jgi:hypothetical protein
MQLPIIHKHFSQAHDGNSKIINKSIKTFSAEQANALCSYSIMISASRHLHRTG